MYDLDTPGECYSNAGAFIYNFPTDNIDEELPFFVIGIVKEIAHAWIEYNDRVINVSFAALINKEEYYHKMNITYSKSFTISEFNEKIVTGEIKHSLLDPTVAKYQNEYNSTKDKLSL